jgi:hypothetical protein
MTPTFLARSSPLRGGIAAYRYALLRVRSLQARQRMLPSFLLIGAQKAGTSSLFSYLVDHPDVRGPYRKEVHYFDNGFHRGERWYRAFFPLAPGTGNGRQVLTGEATPYYLFHPHVPARAHALLPDAKLVVLLRNPVDRAYSQYEHSRRAGLETRGFEEAVEHEFRELPAEEERMSENPGYRSEFHQHRAYVARGRYVEQLERWSRFYPRERMLLMRAEDLFSDPRAVYERTLRFLGLAEYSLAAFDARNQHPYSSRLLPQTRAWLEDHYRPWNERLSEWTGREIQWGSSARAA